MNSLLQPFLRKFVIVFFDDILVYNTSFSDHIHHLHQVFDCLQSNQFFLRQNKCSFAQHTISYLGHSISAAGVSPTSDKIAAILQWPIPSNLKALRGFLGLAGYYRRFIKSFSTLAAPLTDLLQHDAFLWTAESTKTFQTLKTALSSPPILSLPDFSQPFVLNTDASGVGVGAILLQQNRPIAFFSKKLTPRMQQASTYVRELYAIIEAVAKWRQYLLGAHFIIRTDHQSIRELMTQVVQTPEQQRFLYKLLGYSYTIEYKPGRANTVADALSRLLEHYHLQASPTSLHHLISSAIPELLQQLRQEVATDSELLPYTNPTTMASDSNCTIQLRDGLLYKNNRLLLSSKSPLRLQLMRQYHSSPIGGHSGIRRTLHRLQQHFSWPHMKQDVFDFVTTCPICQTTKYQPLAPAGLLQPLPIPQAAWQDLSMDFITHLPPTNDKSTIMVVVDRFTKYAHFIALPASYTATSIASFFIKEVCRHHGIPKTIVSDRDRVFMSAFWRTLFHELGTQLNFSTAHHPESDGQIEVTNRTLE